MRLEGKIVVRDWIMEDLELYKFWNIGYHLWMDFDGPYYPKMDHFELNSMWITLPLLLKINGDLSPEKDWSLL